MLLVCVFPHVSAPGYHCLFISKSLLDEAEHIDLSHFLFLSLCKCRLGSVFSLYGSSITEEQSLILTSALKSNPSNPSHSVLLFREGNQYPCQDWIIE